jgi:hypothetical protein
VGGLNINGRNDMRKILASIVVFYSICSPSVCFAQEFDNIFTGDPSMIIQAKKLVEDYLEGQKNGESAEKASEKYGSGVLEYYGLKEYRFEKNTPECVVYRVQAMNNMGGIVWSNIYISFTYDAKIKTYGGLRIHRILQA